MGARVRGLIFFVPLGDEERRIYCSFYFLFMLPTNGFSVASLPHRTIHVTVATSLLAIEENLDCINNESSCYNHRVTLKETSSCYHVVSSTVNRQTHRHATHRVTRRVSVLQHRVSSTKHNAVLYQ